MDIMIIQIVRIDQDLENKKTYRLTLTIPKTKNLHKKIKIKIDENVRIK